MALRECDEGVFQLAAVGALEKLGRAPGRDDLAGAHQDQVLAAAGLVHHVA
jgi:hypothetical protein